MLLDTQAFPQVVSKSKKTPSLYVGLRRVDLSFSVSRNYVEAATLQKNNKKKCWVTLCFDQEGESALLFRAL